MMKLGHETAALIVETGKTIRFHVIIEFATNKVPSLLCTYILNISLLIDTKNEVLLFLLYS